MYSYSRPSALSTPQNSERATIGRRHSSAVFRVSFRLIKRLCAYYCQLKRNAQVVLPTAHLARVRFFCLSKRSFGGFRYHAEVLQFLCKAARRNHRFARGAKVVVVQANAADAQGFAKRHHHFFFALVCGQPPERVACPLLQGYPFPHISASEGVADVLGLKPDIADGRGRPLGKGGGAGTCSGSAHAKFDSSTSTEVELDRCARHLAAATWSMTSFCVCRTSAPSKRSRYEHARGTGRACGGELPCVRSASHPST